jgi:D-sedoheptulose 7-phosphate isomerase
MYPVALVAGGLATRLRPLTETIPKSLVEVNGQPFLAHQLRLLRSHGIERVVICTGHLGEKIEEFAGDGRAFGLKLEYSPDGPGLRGTAGAVRNALGRLGERFFVVYGDSYLECDYADVATRFEASGRLGLMTVFRNEGQWDTSNVEYADGRILAYDKRERTERMRHIDWGLGAFRREGFDAPENAAAADLAAVYGNLLRQGQLAAYEVTRRFYEIGSFAGIEELSRHLREQMTFSEQFLEEARQVIGGLDHQAIERMATALAETRRRGGRLFILGVGGSAANASHAVNDFRKIAGIEAYAPTDNVSELTARTNDEGWASVFESWLRVSRLRAEDTLLVFSVGGGNLEKNVSPNLVTALQFAKEVGSGILGIVGRDGGYTAQVADACAIIPTVNAVHTTPHAEAFQAVVWHLLVSHPAVKQAQTKWESVR